MPDAPTPWIGLAALLAMFVLPFLPSWLFEGPRTVKHWPRRHVCGYCSAPWTKGHVCGELEAGEAGPPMVTEAGSPLHGELRRLTPPPAELEPPPKAGIMR
ncbi:MAG TPA: hypothetical protein VFA46_05695 [Actinomycetes bacterium]|jgi:hypothetical protein|nr:hypothetical protein [Actinomycetes bacterium]